MLDGVRWEVFWVEDLPLLATVWRMVSCGVLGVRVGMGEGEAAAEGMVLDGLRWDVACHGDIAGGAGWGFSIRVGWPSCWACCCRLRSF